MSVGNRRMKKFVKREWKIDGTEQQMKNVTVEFECVSLGREKRQTVSRIKFFYLREKKFCNKKSSQGCFYVSFRNKTKDSKYDFTKHLLSIISIFNGVDIHCLNMQIRVIIIQKFGIDLQRG